MISRWAIRVFIDAWKSIQYTDPEWSPRNEISNSRRAHPRSRLVQTIIPGLFLDRTRG
jgi:hypothetical protein